MNREMASLQKLRRLMALVKRLRDDLSGARHWAHLRAANFTRVALSRVVIFQHASRCRIRGSSPFVGCGFDARRTSHSVAVQERLAPQSLILEVIGLGRVGPHCIAAYRSHCLRRSARPDPNGADQASWNSR
jgi:hypothetical protein